MGKFKDKVISAGSKVKSGAKKAGGKVKDGAKKAGKKISKKEEAKEGAKEAEATE